MSTRNTEGSRRDAPRRRHRAALGIALGVALFPLLVIVAPRAAVAAREQAGRPSTGATTQRQAIACSQNRAANGRFAPGRGLTPHEHRALQARMQNRDAKGRFTPGYQTFPWVKVTDIRAGDVLTIWGSHALVHSVRRAGGAVEISYRDPEDGLMRCHAYPVTSGRGRPVELAVRKAGQGSTRGPKTGQEIIWIRRGWDRTLPRVVDEPR